MSDERATAGPGELSPVDQAFYDLTVEQRNAAWRTVEALKAELNTLREALEKIDQPGRPEPERGIARAALDGLR